MRLRHAHPDGCVAFRWKAGWQLTDAFETWRLAVAQRQELRIKTANAFQYLYLSLGQKAIKAWQEGVSYQQKVLSSLPVFSGPMVALLEFKLALNCVLSGPMPACHQMLIDLQ